MAYLLIPEVFRYSEHQNTYRNSSYNHHRVPHSNQTLPFLTSNHVLLQKFTWLPPSGHLDDMTVLGLSSVFVPTVGEALLLIFILDCVTTMVMSRSQSLFTTQQLLCHMYKYKCPGHTFRRSGMQPVITITTVIA
jgi:hypothetical protein